MSDSISIIGKIARSKNGIKLGEILRVEGQPNNLTIANSLHVIIESNNQIADSDVVQVLLERMYNVDDEDVYFDISLDELKENQIAYRFSRNQKIQAESAQLKKRNDTKKKTLRTLGRL